MHIFSVVLLGLERGFETNSGGHVWETRTSSLEVNFAHRFAPNVTYFSRMCSGSMTLGSREPIGADGRRNPSRKPEGCAEEESGEQASEERSTKGDERVEILNPSAAALSPGSAPHLRDSSPNPGPVQHPQNPAESAPPCHDQHHFLRSSVRPPSKRIRKDSIGSAINGHGGAKSKGIYKWPTFNWKCVLGRRSTGRVVEGSWFVVVIWDRTPPFQEFDGDDELMVSEGLFLLLLTPCGPPLALLLLCTLAAVCSNTKCHSTVCQGCDSWVGGSFQSGFRTTVFMTLFCVLALMVAEIATMKTVGGVIENNKFKITVGLQA